MIKKYKARSVKSNEMLIIKTEIFIPTVESKKIIVTNKGLDINGNEVIETFEASSNQIVINQWGNFW